MIVAAVFLISSKQDALVQKNPHQFQWIVILMKIPVESRGNPEFAATRPAKAHNSAVRMGC